MHRKFFTFETCKFLTGKRDTKTVQTLKNKNENSIKSKEKPHMHAFKLIINSKLEIVWKVSKGVIKDLIKCYGLICLPRMEN